MSLAKINPKAPLDKVCLISCGFPTGYGAAINQNAGGVRPGSTCAVFGLGAIGLAAVVGCKNAGAKNIIGIDINSSKFEIAKELGVTHCVNPNDLQIPFLQYMAENFDAIEFTFECVGRVLTMKQAYECSAFGNGVCVVIGVADTEAMLDISPLNLLLGKSIKGALYGGYKSVDAAPKLVEEYLDGKFDLDKFITHHIKLDDVNEGFELLKMGKCLRTIIHFN
jgi:Zn-dependent alcohol dehydrogenase